MEDLAGAVKTAGETLRDLRAAEVAEQDLHIEQSGEIIFRTKLRLSFKHDVAHAHVHQQNDQPGASRPDLRGFRPDLARPSALLMPAAPGLIPVSARGRAAGQPAGGRRASAGHRAGRSHRRAAVSPCRGNGRFPYTRITGDLTRTIASDIGCTLARLGAGFLEDLRAGVGGFAQFFALAGGPAEARAGLVVGGAGNGRLGPGWVRGQLLHIGGCVVAQPLTGAAPAPAPGKRRAPFAAG